MPPAKGKGNGKKKGKGKGNSKKTKSRASDPTCNCIFPREIISNILSRLPVKSLLRFRCVCKPWRNLISKPNFIAAHFSHSSALQRSGSSILLHTRHYETSDHVVSLYNPLEESVVELESPHPCFFPHTVVLGPINGIVCLFQKALGDVITLWNPAMRQSKMVPLSGKKPDKRMYCWVSIGLAFDPEENDILILRIFCVAPSSTVPNHVEMYSTKSFGWKKLKCDLVCNIISYTCLAIVKGVPYWLALITDEFGVRTVLVRFDVGKKVLEKLPMPGTGEVVHQCFVAIDDSIGLLTREERDECYISVWVMDEEDGWSKKCKVGPIFGFDRIVGCLRNGDIVVENENGLLFFDPVTSSVKAKVSVDNAKKGSYEISNYSESLLLIGGMLPVKKQAKDKLARQNLIRDCLNFVETSLS
ncbi:PREDICTED: putative F-box protein At3g10240 [Nicotiana attenuata]|uniref:F-box protein n=1 Tax=Nicotiana attenuata TaxID=49451 RepID=A0A1J6J5D0_NICAT|nr:PREDICTED: putative F-box protein At3g10240 [Nicotiana attenuata]OIT06099.1 putative f-box protein [Nicotiana attenuata]